MKLRLDVCVLAKVAASGAIVYERSVPQNTVDEANNCRRRKRRARRERTEAENETATERRREAQTVKGVAAS